MSDDRFATFPLSGEMVVGRSSAAEIQLANPSISRLHVRVYAGPPFLVEDLGSANGTQLRGARLPPNQRTEVHEGETVLLGEVVMRIQRRDTCPLSKQFLAHGVFMRELRGQCGLAAKDRQGLALVRVSCPTPAAGSKVQDELAGMFRLGDILGQYAPQEFEVAVVGRSLGDVRSAIARVERAEISKPCGIGVAFYGPDGTHPDALLARATARCRSGETTAAVIVEEPVEEALGSVIDLIRTVGPSDLTALILGETGVGKEVVAELIHRYSPRSDAPFVKINCAVLSETLLESELFGHQRGAFTGADQPKPGLIESADGGTVFLDEIAELPARLQAKLLEILEARSVRRVGAVDARPIDVRFLAATNRDLLAEIEAKTFRSDLFYRLNGVTIAVPPLRERKAHITQLAEAFLDRAAQRAHRTHAPRLSAEAAKLMKDYAWPGNVRELRNSIERAVLVTPGEEIRAADFTFVAAAQDSSSPEVPSETIVSTSKDPTEDTEADDLAEELKSELTTVERTYIVEALRRTGGNQTRAARLLGKSRNWLVNKLRDHSITPKDWAGDE